MTVTLVALDTLEGARAILTFATKPLNVTLTVLGLAKLMAWLMLPCERILVPSVNVTAKVSVSTGASIVPVQAVLLQGMVWAAMAVPVVCGVTTIDAVVVADEMYFGARLEALGTVILN